MSEEQQKFDLAKREGVKVQKMLSFIKNKGQEILTTEDYQAVCEIKISARSLRMKVEDLTDPFLKIQKAAYDMTKAAADKHIKPLKEVESTSKKLIVDWERKMKEEQEVRDSGVDCKKEFFSKGTGIRTTWQVDKTKLIDMTKVPMEYLMIDLVKLNTIARESKGRAQIPGVTFIKA